MSKWEAGAYKISTEEGLVTVEGFVCQGLGMHMHWDDYNPGWYEWNITHLRSGLRFVIINADDGQAFEIADMVVQMADWSAFANDAELLAFDPDIPERLLNLEDELDGAMMITSEEKTPEMRQLQQRSAAELSASVH